MWCGVEGNYTTGDSAWLDADGYCWIAGRIDDMLNVSGHLLSTAEIESALNEHPLVAESAVVPKSHSIKGLLFAAYLLTFVSGFLLLLLSSLLCPSSIWFTDTYFILHLSKLFASSFSAYHIIFTLVSNQFFHVSTGECLYSFVTLKDGVSGKEAPKFDEKLVGELKTICRKKIGPFATPDFIQSAPGLPKTRSGRILSSFPPEIQIILYFFSITLRYQHFFLFYRQNHETNPEANRGWKDE